LTTHSADTWLLSSWQPTPPPTGQISPDYHDMKINHSTGLRFDRIIAGYHLIIIPQPIWRCT